MTSTNSVFGGGGFYSKPPRKVTQEERKLIILTFHRADFGMKGYLTREDFTVATLMLLGYKPSKAEVDQMLWNTSSKDFQGISEELFIALMSQKMGGKDEEDEIHQTFLTFDNQCRNFLTLEDLHKVFNKIAPNLPKHRVDAAFREIDRDGDGRVSYRDFEFMMKYNIEDGI